jgi:predicted AlkP superfamily pyrophosphatase or phosphodiesterase
MRLIPVLITAAWLASTAAAQDRKLLIVSIDGLDHRYLKDRDALKLRTPNLRKLVDSGSLVDGVVGIVPTVTWLSHTTLITGVGAEQHGILDNNLTTAAGQYRWGCR